MKLNQVLAIEKGVKASSTRALTDLHRKAQTQALYDGRERTYQPLNEEGEKFPPESQKVQIKAKNVLKEVQSALSELFDVTFTKDSANMSAVADVKVDGTSLLTAVPVTYLLFLEKQLTDLHTFVAKMPILDPSENWQWDDGQSAFRSPVVETAKTKKTIKPVILHPATKEHPAQVKEVSEDVVIGYWRQTRFSGALTQEKKDDILDRIHKLQQAVKFAREEANSVTVTKKEVAGAIFSYVFSGV